MLLAVCQELDLETDSKIIPRIAFGFAGGFSNTGAVCGAVMAISLKTGRGGTPEEGFRAPGVVQEFRRRFEAEMDTINCHQLTGAVLTTEEGIQQFMSSDTPQTVCFPAVGLAYRLAVDLLKETSMSGGRNAWVAVAKARYGQVTDLVQASRLP